MNVQLISLAAVLAVLAGCPDTPPEPSGNDGRLEVAKPAVNQAEAATVREVAPESAERFDH